MTNSLTLKPIRITMISERYEVAASLFDSVFGDVATQEPQPLSSAEEMLMGIFADTFEDSGSDFFVKPADPAVLRAKKEIRRVLEIVRMEDNANLKFKSCSPVSSHSPVAVWV